MRKAFRLFMAAAHFCLLTTGVVQAREMIQGENCRIAADQDVEGSLFTFCQNLQIEGRFDGNLIGIALRAIITGEIRQNVYLAGLELDVTGTIQRDLHFVGLSLNVLGTQAQPIRGQLIFAALSSQVAAGVQIPGKVNGIGYQFLIDGAIDGEVSYWGSAFALNNTIKANVYANVGNPEFDASDLETLLLPLGIELKTAVPGLTVDRDGRIAGDLKYFGPAEGTILGIVEGEVRYHSTSPSIIQTVPDQGALNHFLDRFIREIVVLFTVGLLGLALMDAGIIGPFFFMAISVARAVIALATGVFALAIVTSLPVIGFVFNAGALFLGSGAIAIVTVDWMQSFRTENYASTRPPIVNRGDAEDAMQDSGVTEIPANAPMLPSGRELGLANLPQGFDPDFFFSDD